MSDESELQTKMTVFLRGMLIEGQGRGYSKEYLKEQLKRAMMDSIAVLVEESSEDVESVFGPMFERAWQEAQLQ